MPEYRVYTKRFAAADGAKIYGWVMGTNRTHSLSYPWESPDPHLEVAQVLMGPGDRILNREKKLSGYEFLVYADPVD